MLFQIPYLVGKAGYGLYQARKAKKQLDQLKRPQMDIPKEIMDNLTLAQQRALEGLPEEQRQQFIRNIQRSTSQAVNRAADRRSGLVGMSGLHQQEIDAYSNLLAQDVAARRANEAQLMQQRANVGGLRLQQFEVNQMQPYRQQYNEARALQASGIQNISGAAQQFAEGVDKALAQTASMLAGGITGGGAGAAISAAGGGAGAAAGGAASKLAASNFQVPALNYQMGNYNLSGQPIQQQGIGNMGSTQPMYQLPPVPQPISTGMYQIAPQSPMFTG